MLAFLEVLQQAGPFQAKQSEDLLTVEHSDVWTTNFRILISLEPYRAR